MDSVTKPTEPNSDATRQSRGEPLSPVDAAWFRMGSDRNPADILALLSLEGEVDEAELRSTLVERLLPHRRFRRRVVESPLGIGAPHWEDEPDFSLDRHLHRRRVEPPGGEEQVEALLNELANEPLDFELSPWQVTLIEGSSTGSMLLAQIHHCMGDGFALLDLVLSLSHDAVRFSAPSAQHPSPEPHVPGDARLLARRVSQRVMDLGHLLLLPFDPMTRLRRPPTGRRRIASARGTELSSVRALAKAHGATVNDVILTALTGALRRYLEDHGDALQSFRAFIPVNLRPPSEPMDEEHGNWFGLVFADLPIAEPTRAARLAAIKRCMDRIKASEEPFVSLAVMNVLGLSPAVVEHIADDVLARKATLVVTNVPGPRERFTLAGRPVLDMRFWAPHPCGLSCGVSVLSYAGMIRVGVRGDEGVLPDPERLARYFDEEVLAWQASELEARH